EARICGFEVRSQPREARRCIGYMPDVTPIYEDMTAEEYLLFFAAVCGIRGSQAQAVVRDVLALVELSERAHSAAATLSRGMRQRLGIARALLHDPKVLLLDEPTSGLDPIGRLEMRALLQELTRMGKTILISSHLLAELADICQKAVILQSGRVIYQGAISDLLRGLQRRDRVHIRVAPADYPPAEVRCLTRRAAEVLRQERAVAAVDIADNGLLVAHLATAVDNPSFLAAALLRHGCHLYFFGFEPLSLDEAFARLLRQGNTGADN
ncbi:MAG: ABC transporter ATP-binding protein, partial [Planctomycetota bacterium]|nr:ABC transporter ATP-binding protein [Planctomycetota bacterium]